MTTTGYTSTVRGDAVETAPQTVVAPRSVSWGAIWAGFFVVLGIEVVLSTLLVGVFAASIRPGAGAAPGWGYAIGIAIWFFLQNVLAFYAGGQVAGYFARRLEPRWSAMHAVAVWGLATTAIMWTLSSSSEAVVRAALNAIRFGIGIAVAGAQAIGPAGGSGSPGVLGGVSSALAAAPPEALAVATWIPIFLFVVFTASFFASLAGGRSALRR